MVGFLRCCVVGLLSLSVLAVEAAPRQKPVVRPASAQDTFVKGQGTAGQQTLDIDRHWGEVIDVPGSRATVPVKHKSVYSPSRIGGALKNLVKLNPARYLATAGVMLLIDSIPDSTVINGVPHVAKGDPTPGDYACTTGVPCWSSSYHKDGSGSCTKPSQIAAFECSANLKGFSTVIQNQGMVSGTYYIYSVSCKDTQTGCSHFNLVPQNQYNSHKCPVGTIYSSALFTCQVPPAPVPFVDSDYDLMADGVGNLSQDHWSELGPMMLQDVPATFDGPDFQDFSGPASMQGSPTVTTSTDIGTGNTTVTESIPSFTFDYSTDPLSITTNTTTVNNTYENGVKTSTSTTVQTSPSTGVETVPEIEFPTDCDFMPTVCSFIDWVKDPFEEEEPDLSDLIADDDFQKNIDFSSNASCPAPSIMATSQGSFEFSWQPACQWAGMVKPFIIIAALIAAIFINLGAIRGPK